MDLHHRGQEAHRGITEAIDPKLSWDIIGCGMRVHTMLGPGLLESVYEECLCHELNRAGLRFRRQVESPIRYGDLMLVEVKAVDQVLKLHEAQLLTYLRLTGKRLGLLRRTQRGTKE